MEYNRFQTITKCYECPHYHEGIASFCLFYEQQVLDTGEKGKPEWCKVIRIITEEAG